MQERTPKFAVGDIVYLKSGGPALTISAQLQEHKHYNSIGVELKPPFIPSQHIHRTEVFFSGEYEVQWFGESNNSLNNATFIEETLEKA